MNDERLYRSRDDRIIAGVAGGLAERLDLDPSIVRVAWAVLALLSGGVLFLAYIVMAIVVPEAPPGYVPPNHRPWQPEGAWPSASETGPASGGGPDPAAGAPSGAATGAGSGTGPTSGPGASSGMGAPPPPNSTAWTRSDWRAQRRAERAERRARGGGGGALFLGVILVLVGSWWLARRFIPAFDWDLLWPVLLIALGALLLLAAVRPRPPER